jgi:hypothetical protein
MAPKRLTIQRAALEHHQRVGKALIPPFQRVAPGTDQIFWMRDFLPEFLWIDALVQVHGEECAVSMFIDFLSAADPFNSHAKIILDGTVGAFRFIKEDQRPIFVETLAEKIATAVARPFGHILSLYPGCPMSWMVPGLPRYDRDSGIKAVREALLRLFDGKDSHPGFCRALPFQRILAHKKIKIASHLTETIEAIKMYPRGDKYRAETFARITHNMMILERAKTDPDTFAWARYFWNSNDVMVPCKYEWAP